MEEQKLSLIKRLHNNPKAQRLLMVLAIIYVLSPLDIVPDAMPLVGWLDDAGIILAEIAQYLVYMKNKKDAFEAAAKREESTNNEEKK